MIDLTCPFVSKIHRIVSEHHDKGYQIVIVGDKNHPEVIGINGWCEGEAVIINDVDDMVHAQTQGRLGMFNDINVLANQKKLVDMVCRFVTSGYDVYVTADHGNTTCTGLGKLMGTGVEMETKSRKFLVLRNFADKDKLM